MSEGSLKVYKKLSMMLREYKFGINKDNSSKGSTQLTLEMYLGREPPHSFAASSQGKKETKTCIKDK
jgi:hypothetical protein